MPRHIQQTETQLPDGLVTFHIIRRFFDFFNQFLRNGFARFTMLREQFQSFGFIAVIFHELRWQFYKIIINIRSGKTFVSNVSQNSMQGMAEFVKQSGYFIESQKRRFFVRGFCEIANDRNMRPFLVAVYIGLPSELRHPSAGFFAFSREEIRIKQSQMFFVLIKHFINLYISMVFVNSVSLLKLNSI